VVKLVIFASARIGKAEEVVLLAASVGAEPACLKDGLRQYYVRVKDAFALDFGIEVGNGQGREIVNFRFDGFFFFFISLPLKLQMTADRNGQPALITYPVRAEMEQER